MEKDRKPGGMPPMDDDMANELEILRLMKGYQSGGKNAEVDKAAAEVIPPAAPPEEPEANDSEGGYALVFEAPEAAEEAAAPRRKFTDVLLDLLGNVVPKKGDAPLEIVRKCVFVIALLVLIGSVSYIVYDMVIIPANNDRLYSTLDGMYDPNNPAPVLDKYKDFPFPEGIDDAFKNIYPINTELRGWIKYNSKAKNDFLKISYPILYSGDNDKYLTTDFYGNSNKNGALFFDKRNSIDSPASHNKVSIIYGHNMASGQMFSGINKFLNSVYNVRSAPVITMNTLYHRNEYKVFAVIMIDNGTASTICAPIFPETGTSSILSTSCGRIRSTTTTAWTWRRTTICSFFPPAPTKASWTTAAWPWSPAGCGTGRPAPWIPPASRKMKM